MKLLKEIVGGVVAFFALMTMFYPGMLLSSMKRIPFWNTPMLPLLFISTSLYTAMAFLLLIGNLFLQTQIDDLHSLVTLEIILIFVQLVILGIFIWASNYSGITMVESIKLLETPFFKITTIILGLIIPLFLLIYQNVVNSGGFLIILFATLLLISGGFILRFYLIKRGIRLSITL